MITFLLTQWRLLVLFALAAALVFVGYQAGSWRSKAQLEHERAEAAQALAKVEADYRQRETKLRTEHQEIEDAGQAKQNQLAADVLLARTTSDSLRGAVAAARAKAAKCPTAQPSGPASADPAGVLAIVLSELDERAGEVAEYADRERIGHETCVREYGAVEMMFR